MCGVIAGASERCSFRIPGVKGQSGGGFHLPRKEGQPEGRGTSGLSRQKRRSKKPAFNQKAFVCSGEGNRAPKVKTKKQKEVEGVNKEKSLEGNHAICSNMDGPRDDHAK